MSICGSPRHHFHLWLGLKAYPLHCPLPPHSSVYRSVRNAPIMCPVPPSLPPSLPSFLPEAQFTSVHPSTHPIALPASVSDALAMSCSHALPPPYVASCGTPISRHLLTAPFFCAQLNADQGWDFSRRKLWAIARREGRARTKRWALRQWRRRVCACDPRVISFGSTACVLHDPPGAQSRRWVGPPVLTVGFTAADCRSGCMGGFRSSARP